MIVGDTLQLQLVEVDSVPFTSTGNSSLIIHRPDGIVELPLAVTPVNGEKSTLSMTFYSQQYTFQVAGEYLIYWKLKKSSSVGQLVQTVTRGIRYFCSWTDIDSQVRNRLILSPTLLLDSTIEPITGMAVRQILVNNQNISPYANLQLGDQIPFDEAAGLVTSALLRKYLPKSTSIGELTRTRNGPTEFFFQAPAGTQQSPEQDWLNQAWESLKQISTVQSAWTQVRASARTFLPAGQVVAMRESGIRRPFDSIQRFVIDQAFELRYGFPTVLINDYVSV